MKVVAKVGWLVGRLILLRSEGVIEAIVLLVLQVLLVTMMAVVESWTWQV